MYFLSLKFWRKKPELEYLKHQIGGVCIFWNVQAMPLLEFAIEAKEYNVLVDSKLKNEYGKEEMGRMVCCAAACVYKPEEKRPGMYQVCICMCVCI